MRFIKGFKKSDPKETIQKKLLQLNIGEKAVYLPQEIDKEDLPELIRSKINSEFSGYTIDDAKQIVERNVTTYSIELDSSTEELELKFNSEGVIIDKKAD